ncbi:unnamed protein product, partial [Diamesa tonsa]
MTYHSSTGYNALGMAPLYNLTNKLIDLFVDAEEPIPPGYLVVNDREVTFGPHVQNHEYGDLIKKYWAMILVVLVCVITAFLMPLIGLCFCCCRCAGSCGGRSQPFDKKHDTCRRFFLGFCLLVVASSMIFGVIVAYVTNITLQHGVENSTVSARYAVDDTRSYLKSTTYHVRHLLVDNYAELKLNLYQTLDKTSETVVTQLDKASNAVSLQHLQNIVESLPEIKNNLIEMKRLTSDMQQKASQLNDGLRGVKRELLKSLQICKTSECKQVQKDYEIGRLDENGIDYDQLPDQTRIIDDVNLLLDSSLRKTVENSEEKVNEIKDGIKNVIKSNVPEIKLSITKVGGALRNISDQAVRQIDHVADVAGNYSYKHFNTADDYIAQYSVYRYYAGLIISSVLLIVLVFVTFGLLCGICGKRPDGYGDDCCTKGAGSRFLMCGVAVIFLTVSALIVICLASFIIGIVLRRGACDPLRNPQHDQVFEYLDNYIDVNKFLFADTQRNNQKNGAKNVKDIEPLRISQIINSCHSNESIFEVLRLDSHVNISEIVEFPKQYGIDAKLNELVDNVAVNSKIRILTNEARAEIRELSKSALNDFAAYKYTDNLTQNITNFNLNDLADRLKATAARVPDINNEIRTSLGVQELHLRTYQKNYVEPLVDGTNRLLTLSKGLEDSLHFKQMSFEKAILKLIQEIDQAEAFLNEKGTEYVKQVVEELLESFTKDIDSYLQLVINATRSDVGKCGPIANVYSSLIVATCNRVVDPFNGFWAGVTFCLLLFFPTIILSAKLSTLYQKSDPYPGPLVEAEYLYDAYSERDHIPLANVPKNKRRRKNDRRHDGRDRRGDYYEESPATTAAAAAAAANPHRDARFTDMAPKNWDGAPPRYQNTPHAPPMTGSEYERPPPYYFPG